jgi:hypothetical protein
MQALIIQWFAVMEDRTMFTLKNAKTLAKSLRDSLVDRNVSLSHSTCLEIVARQLGFADWNTLSATLPAAGDREIPLGEAETYPEIDATAQTTRTAEPWSSCSFCGKSRHEAGRLFARAAGRSGVTFSSAMNALRLQRGTLPIALVQSQNLPRAEPLQDYQPLKAMRGAGASRNPQIRIAGSLSSATWARLKSPSHEADCQIVAVLHIPAHLHQAPSGAATATSLKMFINLASDTGVALIFYYLFRPVSRMSASRASSQAGECSGKVR